jgi:hypothetical protein
MEQLADTRDWTASDLVRDERWRFHLTRAQSDELRAGVDGAMSRRSPASLLDFAPQDFDFGSAIEVFRAATAEAMRGRGLALVRGVDVAQFDETRFRLLTWGLGLHLGVAAPQGKASQYISDVRDAGGVYKSPTGRGYNTRVALDYHSDPADLVMLSTLRRARTGGESIVSSTIAAHREMAVRDPALCEVLHSPFWYGRQGEEAPDERPAYKSSIFAVSDGVLLSRYVRKNITFGQTIPHVPKLGANQLEALDLFDSIISDPTLAFRMTLEPGDFQILNNYCTVHSRTAFEDYEEEGSKRHLFRLWLSTPDGPRLPDSWADFCGVVAPGGVRRGVRGHAYDRRCAEFERRVAAWHHMVLPEAERPESQRQWPSEEALADAARGVLA